MFSREQQYMDFKQWAHSEQERLGKRQYEVERETNDALGNLREGLQEETQDRIECQDGIVENITLFVKRFQDNIKEDGAATAMQPPYAASCCTPVVAVVYFAK